MLLRESLGNLNCRTTMIAHISAAAASYAETLSTIQIASRVLRMKKKKTKVRGARRVRAARSCGGPARSPVGKSRARTSNPWAPGPGAQRPRKETENPQAGPGTVTSRPPFSRSSSLDPAQGARVRVTPCPWAAASRREVLEGASRRRGPMQAETVSFGRPAPRGSPAPYSRGASSPAFAGRAPGLLAFATFVGGFWLVLRVCWKPLGSSSQTEARPGWWRCDEDGRGGPWWWRCVGLPLPFCSFPF